jgi:diguanylate cyclase (GGDEF)-like protein/PAS domain S-box-containing protein
LNKRRFFYSIPIILLLIVAVSGWFATNYLGNKARQEIIGESQALVLTLSIYVSATLNNLEGAVKSLTGSPWIAPALMSKRDQDIEHANSVLDRYNSVLNASVSYLMDTDGITVASSNRKDPDSFVGKSYRFRPYFQEAAKGQPNRYFALGITSGKRGFYASYPVQNRLGKVVGVVTMKKDLDEMETFFSKYPFCFLISPDGIIFLSSTPSMVLKSLWPLDKAVREKLIASRQFGNKLSESVIKKEIADGTEVTLEENDYFVSRNVIDSDGWSIVLLTPIHHVKISKLISILSTIFVCFLIMVFSGITYVTDRSKEAIRRSEESKRLLLHAAGEGIFGVDTTGQLTFVNPAALRMLGFAEEEMLGQRVHALIHYSHKDGSNYLVEDCPMYASYNKATESRVTDEFLWRKDGSGFPVEYSSMPITGDGIVIGAVVTFRDITERKRVEEVLYRSEERYRTIIDQMEDGYFETNLRGDFTFVNDAECRNIGYPREELLGMSRKQYADEKNAKALYNLFAGVYKTGVPVKAYALELIRKDGAKAYDEISVSLIRTAEGKPIGFRGISRDVTERKQMEDMLRESEDRYRSIFAASRDAIMTLEPPSWAFTSGNPATIEMFRAKNEADFLSHMPWTLSPELQPDGRASDDKAREMINTAMRESFCFFEWVHKRIGGEEFFAEVLLSRVKQGEKIFLHALVRDVTERKQTEEKIQQMAYHDSLTGLPNRKLFSDRLGIVLAQAQRNQKKVGIAMLDLDNFKGVNDTMGHAVGDLLLQATAERLGAALRKSDTVARIGGDEFVLILPDLKVIEDAIQVAQKIVDSFCKPFFIDTHQLVVTTSIGIAVYPHDGTDESILLKKADSAMYQAKQAGRARYQLHKKA